MKTKKKLKEKLKKYETFTGNQLKIKTKARLKRGNFSSVFLTLVSLKHTHYVASFAEVMTKKPSYINDFLLRINMLLILSPLPCSLKNKREKNYHLVLSMCS